MSDVASQLDPQETAAPSPSSSELERLAPSVAAGVDRISIGVAVAFSAQSLFSAAMAVVIAVYMSKFYVDVVLVPAGIVAVIIAAGRSFDALTDPIMGYITDHTRTRWGRRKPWIFAGTVGNAVTYYLLFAPPATLTPTGAIAWYAPVLVLNLLFYTMSFVPRQALSVELTLDAVQRHRLYGMSATFIAAGTILGAVMPTVLQGAGVLDVREQMRIEAAILIGGYLVLNMVLLAIIQERPGFMGRGEVPFVPGVRRALRNRPFRLMFVSHVIAAVPLAIPAVLMPFFVQYVLRMNVVRWTGVFTLVYLASGLVCVPLWVAIARRWGKLAVWKVVSVIAVTGCAALYTVGPGDAARMFVIELYVGSQSAAWFFLFGSMHADVVDYDELLTGKRREAQFSSILSIVPKFALIPGAAIPLALLGAAGYAPNVARQPEAVVRMLRLLFAVVPPILNVIAFSIMWRYPLSESRHREIRAAVAMHAHGQPAIDPMTGRKLLPPQGRDVDEATSWFLDYFSRRELHAFLERPSRVPLSAAAWCAAFAGVMVLAVVDAARHVGSPDHNPGPRPALAIVVAGFALALALYHALRIGPALRLVRRPPSREVVDRHLATME